MQKSIQVLFLIIASAAPGFADILSFSLTPAGGAISGAPGETIGWGFSISNPNNDYALVTSATYLNDPSQGSVVGTFTDFISQFQFVAAGPSDGFVTPTVSQDFSLNTLEGTGSFLVDPAAVASAHSGGTILLTYDLYTVDPNDPSFDPGADLESSGNTVSTNASVDVTAVPEPWSVALLATVLVSLLLLRRKMIWVWLLCNDAPSVRK